ncbi:iron-containing alcohol dehydrogenase [Clostridium sp. MSJ-8]|uniref:iron-containing alcohol dehydrogenase n=1 Tax=Clostridium sp. MSJ-8 TaxID=2841510 RepID=UPI001C0EA08A|nr:iron-containing alcohol dehydrogenase [Clostridium sp. MSJ-8]MBU5486684.1 iron-containing alcohol dehydrogenase [Clostridium sp. MSJ-8]
MSYNFLVPGNTIIGEDALKSSGDYLKSYGKKAFIVTGKVVTKTGLVNKLTDYLDELNIDYIIFNDITGEPTDIMIESGVKEYKANDCDFCIAIGGGSPLDSAKAIAAMTVLDGSISDYIGKEIRGDFPKLVLIPTTAGTGSETTKFTVITDSKKDIKMLLKGDALIPDLAIVDYNLTVSAPKSVTAATGMDALTHAVESYTSRKANPITDMYALSAIKRIFKYLPIAYKDGGNLEARKEMSLAAFEAGVCINNASVTIVHGMSRPIGALFHVPHGISNAMLIKECLKYVLDGAYDKFADIARAIKVADEDMEDKEAASKFLDALDDLCKAVEIPTLEEYGIDKAEFDKVKEKMAKDAMDSGSPSNTIKVVDKDDLIKIYDILL